jgi:dCTP diphosphatase
MNEAARIVHLQGLGPTPADQVDPSGAEQSHRDSLTVLAKRLRDFRAKREWEQFHTPLNLAVSISIESGELLEHFQWINDESAESKIEQRQGPIAEELADVVIYAIQLAEVLDIPLSDAIDSKIELNERRYPPSAVRGSSRKYTELHDVDSSVERR